jgi:anti-sigma regulatory factor (Ser/Thr protein kinase)
MAMSAGRSGDVVATARVATARDLGVAVELEIRGELSLRTVPQLRRLLEKHLADRGRVLVDLSGLEVNWPPAVEVFVVALASATGWPAARLVLFGAGGDTERALRTTGSLAAAVHLAGDRAQALELLQVRPRRLSRRMELACEVESAKWARMLVDSVCEDWDVRDVEPNTARLVVSELVSNAVQHARTSSLVTLILTDRVLRIAVRDYLPGAWPDPDPAERERSVSLGLTVVAAVSSNWGVLRHEDGKTVWASLPRTTAGRT